VLFTSLEFIVFLTVLIVLYYTIAKNRFQWQLLLAASLAFYAFSGWWNLFYIASTIISSYFAGRAMGRLEAGRDAYLKEAKLSKEDAKAYKASVKAKKRIWLIACLTFNFAVLAATKYAGLMISKGADTGFFGFLVPVGISFYTFQAMGYIIDRYRGKGGEHSLFRLALFVSFFPQLIQGPISRFDDLKATLFAPHSFNGAAFAAAGQRVLWGFFKKLVIADRLLPAVTELTSDLGAYGGVYVIAAVLLYAVRLYADFTGGIDITIGVAEMLGIRVKENFNMPFYSKSIAEYWRRWHITMGTWFKDYLFYPISVSRPMLGLMKSAKAAFGENFGKRVPVYLSTIILWFMTGLWHGTTANYIAWGLANGLVIIISQELTPAYKAFHQRFNLKGKRIWNALEIFRTFWLMCFIRAFDIYAGVGETLKAVGSVVTGPHTLPNLVFDGIGVSDYIAAGAGVAVMIIAGRIKRRGKPWINKAAVRYAACLLLALAIVVFGVYGMGYDASQFIYNRF
jgi:D-alanyl-lipoteichoic acid acyltransferase DltB (MBOAT superfamily)